MIFRAWKFQAKWHKGSRRREPYYVALQIFVSPRPTAWHSVGMLIFWKQDGGELPLSHNHTALCVTASHTRVPGEWWKGGVPPIIPAINESRVAALTSLVEETVSSGVSFNFTLCRRKSLTAERRKWHLAEKNNVEIHHLYSLKKFILGDKIEKH